MCCVMIGIVKSVESPGSVCSPQNFCQLSQSIRIGTAKKKVSMYMLSMVGKIGVARRAKPVMLRLNVSPGSASSQNIGMSNPASNAVLHPWLRSKLDRGMSAFGTWLNWCVITDRCFMCLLRR